MDLPVRPELPHGIERVKKRFIHIFSHDLINASPAFNLEGISFNSHVCTVTFCGSDPLSSRDEPFQNEATYREFECDSKFTNGSENQRHFKADSIRSTCVKKIAVCILIFRFHTKNEDKYPKIEINKEKRKAGAPRRLPLFFV